MRHWSERPIAEVIVTERIVGVDTSGRRRDISVQIGRPSVAEDGDARCPVALWGLDGRLPDTAGVSTFQALVLALRLAYLLLEGYQERGGRLYFAGAAPDDEIGPKIDPELLTLMFGQSAVKQEERRR
jgi:hypothetical protein